MSVSGGTDPRFEEVAYLLDRSVSEGDDRGASICIVEDGETVLDIWCGSADLDGQVPWERDTLVPVWSTTKVMTNLAALVLADRGELDLDAPVARYWPEFAAAGKASVTTTHLLSHSSGVAGWAQPVTVDDVYDWDRSTAMLAAQEPWWEPGTASGYHLIDQGHLVGEVVRRITGSSLGTWFAQEIAAPLGADFHIGLDPADDVRVSPLTTPRLPDVDAPGPDSIAARAFTGPYLHAREANTERWRRAEIPAANGHGNARSIARIQALVSHGGEIDGVRLLSSATVERILEPQTSGVDHVLGVPVTFGLGWALPEPRSMPSVAPGRRCFWGGLGGSLVVNDLERRLTFAYAMNRMVLEAVPGTRRTRPCGDSRTDAFLAAVDRAVA